MTNEQIATEVMGLKYDITTGVYWNGEVGRDKEVRHKKLPDFLNDHNAAMMVVEKMREDGWKWLSGSVDSGGHYFEFYKDDCYQEFKVYHESLCHAICEAALKAKGG